MIKSIRILLTIAAYHDYEIWQMDVKIAFLNRNLIKDVYMTQPDGFVIQEHANKICKLQRTIYSLNKHPRVGINVSMKQSKSLIFHKMKMILVFTRRLVGALWSL